MLIIFKDASSGNVIEKKKFKSMIYQLKIMMDFYESSGSTKQNAQQLKAISELREPNAIRSFMESWRNGAKDNNSKMQDFATQADVNTSKTRSKKDNKKRKKTAVWRKKVARYLAYCVDGGLLQEKFTLKTVTEYVGRLD